MTSGWAVDIPDSEACNVADCSAVSTALAAMVTSGAAASAATAVTSALSSGAM